MEERKVVETLEAYKAEVLRTLVDAFNEGYLLGEKHAEKIFKK